MLPIADVPSLSKTGDQVIAAVGRLPHSPAGRPEIVSRRIARNSCGGQRPSAPKRTNQPILHPLERLVLRPVVFGRPRKNSPARSPVARLSATVAVPASPPSIGGRVWSGQRPQQQTKLKKQKGAGQPTVQQKTRSRATCQGPWSDHLRGRSKQLGYSNPAGAACKGQRRFDPSL